MSTRITTTLHWTGSDYRVRLVSELICPECFRPLRPNAVRRDPDAINLICERCHQNILSVELSLKDPTP
jgi:hypothetical protein